MMKKKYGLFTIICLLFCAASTVSAASFDCAKAATNVEKLICSNSEIEELDDKTTIIYSKAMSNSSEEQRSNLITRQIHWLKQVRNICKDIACLNEAYLARITELKSLFKAPADSYELTGIWFNDHGAAHSIYGKIVITDHTIAWGGNGHGNPFCKTQYSIEKEPIGISFKVLGRTYVYNENNDFKTYKLKLPSLAHDCVKNTPITHLRFTLPFDNPNYADVLEYEEHDHITGQLSFGKIND